MAINPNDRVSKEIYEEVRKISKIIEEITGKKIKIVDAYNIILKLAKKGKDLDRDIEYLIREIIG